MTRTMGRCARLWHGGWAAACGAALLMGAAGVAAAVRQVAYVQPLNQGYSGIDLVTWQAGSRARVVRATGVHAGSVADDGLQKLVTLDVAISDTYDAPDADSCGMAYQVRRDTLQLVYRPVAGTPRKGSSQTVSIGTETVLDGCDAGQVRPFGSPTDPGFTVQHLDLTARAPMSDVVAGLQLVGLSEVGFQSGQGAPTVDRSTVLDGGLLRFSATGHELPYEINAAGWLALAGGPSGAQGYMRLTVDARRGTEVWAWATLVNGEPTSVSALWVVKPTADAAWGSARKASRMWESGLSVASRNPFCYYLYDGGAAERVFVDLDNGTESRQAITWRLKGQKLETTITRPSYRRVRLWEPVARYGDHRFVIESEVWIDAAGTRPSIEPRLNLYIDTGKAVPPAQAVARRDGEPRRRGLRL